MLLNIILAFKIQMMKKLLQGLLKIVINKENFLNSIKLNSDIFFLLYIKQYYNIKVINTLFNNIFKIEITK